jgi:hypothetical protein
MLKKLWNKRTNNKIFHFLMRSSFTFLFLSLLYFIPAKGASNNISKGADSLRRPIIYPAPPATANRLFYVQRTPNTNTIVYDINMANNGKSEGDEPIKAYWIRYAEKGQKEDLSFIQRKFAYGLTAKSLDNGNYDIRFVSYKKFPLTLMRSTDGKYHIFAVIDQKQVVLNRVFVKIEGGSFWFPNVAYVELNGTDPKTGREMVERFKP